MALNLDNFVSINIVPHTTSVVEGTRPTVALFTNDAVGSKTELTNLDDANDYSKDANVYKYIEMYFKNNGQKIHIYPNKSSITKEDLSALPVDEIIVAHTSMQYSQLLDLAQNYTEDGIHSKIILARVTSFEDLSNANNPLNFAVKYSTDIGAEMTIAAYLNNIDVYDVNSVHDYAFTVENIKSENISQSQYNILKSQNVNVDTDLANATRVVGGNCKNGDDLVNAFVRIILHQTLSERLTQLLTQKLKSTTASGKIYTTISQELNRYLSCGYLTTDKVWSYDDYVVTLQNGQKYTIIEKGTSLTNGYIVRILPYTSLTEEDKLDRKAPKIYIVIAEQYSIRFIEISGEAF